MLSGFEPISSLGAPEGSFCRYRGTDYVQQKKQYNQTIKRHFFKM